MRIENIERYIRCDDCGTDGMNGRNFTELQKDLTLLGWLFYEDKDLCPDCAEKRTNNTQDKILPAAKS
jgi:hypothetical protein